MTLGCSAHTGLSDQMTIFIKEIQFQNLKTQEQILDVVPFLEE